MGAAAPDFIYISYIASTQDKVWKALIDPEFTSQYFFGVKFDTDWRPGSVIHVAGPKGEKIQWGTVEKFEVPRLLAYTFDGPAHGVPVGQHPTLATFEVEPHGSGVRLYLTHSRLTAEDYEARKDTFRGLNNGWPAILS